jgi:hypothetical protein
MAAIYVYQTAVHRIDQNGHKIYQQLTLQFARPSKIYPNWNFCLENKPSGNPEHTYLFSVQLHNFAMKGPFDEYQRSRRFLSKAFQIRQLETFRDVLKSVFQKTENLSREINCSQLGPNRNVECIL